MSDVYRFEFCAGVPLEEIEATILLAILATESIHGESQTRLDASHFLDAERHALVVDSGTAVGKDLARLMIGFVRHEFGEDACRVRRVSTSDRVVEATASG